MRRLALLLTVVALSVSGCGSLPAAASQHLVRVVAAENFWGSIAAQVGGPGVEVTSIVAAPDADPHSYEPSTADARAVAVAKLVVVNGVGYDPWASKLLAAAPGPAVLDVGHLLGLHDGDNPHRWYDPDDVGRFVAGYAAALGRVDPAHAAAYRANAAAFASTALAPYHQLVDRIRATYAGTPVGASESIFAMLSPALGLDLVTPPTFLRAVSEGTDVSAADLATIDQQIAGHRIRLYVVNSQNTTPDVAAQAAAARAAGIPVSTITETLIPPTATFQAWQVAQLQGILAALGGAR